MCGAGHGGVDVFIYIAFVSLGGFFDVCTAFSYLRGCPYETNGQNKID